MRKIILSMSVSLDGFIEGPDRQIDWHMVDDELHSHFNEQLRTMGAFLSGRVTHELMAAFWPTADSDPVVGVRVRQDDSVDSGRIRISLQRSRGSGAQVEQQPAVARLNQIAGACGIGRRRRSCAAHHGQAHGCDASGLPQGAVSHRLSALGDWHSPVPCRRDRSSSPSNSACARGPDD